MPQVLDKLTRMAIADVVSKEMQKQREQYIELKEKYEEIYLTADNLCERCQMITKEWIKRHPDVLPRERIEFAEGGGSTRWGYPLHRILRGIAEHEFKGL